MDIKLLERNHQLLILAGCLLALVLFWPGRAEAAPAMQNGACPPNSFLVTTPQGTYQDDLVVCSYNLLRVHTQNNVPGRYPCTQRVTMEEQTPWSDGTEHVIYVPDNDQYYGSQLRFRALVYAIEFPYQFFPPAPLPGAVLDTSHIGIQHYNSGGFLSAATFKSFTEYQAISTYFEDFPWTYTYKVYLIDETFYSATGQGGYIRVRIAQSNDQSVRWPVGIASVRLGSQQDNMPEHCEIPNANLPGPTPGSTSTLPPTWTPNATTVGTPSPTPVLTPPPTSVGGTPGPQWTPTPLSFPTVPAENTPTAWAPYSIATINWPDLPPTVVPAGFPTVDVVTTGIEELANAIENEWSPAMEFGQGVGDLDNAALTGTGSPNQIVSEVTAVMSGPISYVKAIQTYLPNTAPYVGFLILAVSWIPFNMMFKFGLSIIARLFELIRRIVELIPGF
jgi:hypothetical protein